MSVAAAVAHFNQAGLSTRLDAGNLLRVTGSAQAMQKAFGAPLHVFDVAVPREPLLVSLDRPTG